MIAYDHTRLELFMKYRVTSSIIMLVSILLAPFVSPGVSFAGEKFSGPPKVLEGDLLKIGSKTFRLYGIDAPEKGQTCQGTKRIHNCGRIAVTGLMDLTAGVASITCEVLGTGYGGQTIARCLDPQGFDLSRQMLYTGWAFATPAASVEFHQMQEKSNRAKRGMWKWQVMRPWRWQNAQ
jgi:endonuclease YncB( thermonuclease family)